MEVAINENLKKAIYRYFWRTILDKSTIFVVLIALACLIFLFYNFDKYTFYMFVSRMLFFSYSLFSYNFSQVCVFEFCF